MCRLTTQLRHSVSVNDTVCRNATQCVDGIQGRPTGHKWILFDSRDVVSSFVNNVWFYCKEQFSIFGTHGSAMATEWLLIVLLTLYTIADPLSRYAAWKKFWQFNVSFIYFWELLYENCRQIETKSVLDRYFVSNRRPKLYLISTVYRMEGQNYVW